MKSRLPLARVSRLPHRITILAIMFVTVPALWVPGVVDRWGLGLGSLAVAAGEPAEQFVKQLRQAGYFDTAIAYLDRLDRYPGVDPELLGAVDLEKAQTYIDAAVAARNAESRDRFFELAEQQLVRFVRQKNHPRLSEARLQLGKLQMVRAAQLMSGKPDAQRLATARESYLNAAKTFTTIVEDLRAKLKEMQGARIDPEKDPEGIARRDRYRGEFLEAMANAGHSRLHAALTYESTDSAAEPLLKEALGTFQELTEKYGRYVPGAVAWAQLGRVQEALGMTEQAVDSYLRMLQQEDADPLRDAKYQAAAGLVRLSLAKSPPDFDTAIQHGQPLLDQVRPAERTLLSVQELRLGLGRAYLTKAADKDNQKPVDIKRASIEGRKLLTQVVQSAGPLADQAKEALAGVGVDLNASVELPKTEEPESVSDALEKARALLAAVDSVKQSLAVLENQAESSPDVAAQKKALQEQLQDTQWMAIQTMQRGLSKVTPESDFEEVNQLRQYLAYMLYQQKFYRDTVVVGQYLAQNAPGTELGLRGGLLALNALQMLVIENPRNATLSRQLESLGTYLTSHWPDNAEVGVAQGVMVRLALKNEDWQTAQEKIEQISDGVQRAFFRRLLGQLLWNESLRLRQAGEDEQADEVLKSAADQLAQGLAALPEGSADEAAVKAALVLSKIYLRLQQVDQASQTLEHAVYGPVTYVSSHPEIGDEFTSDVYSTQLQVLVHQMTVGDSGATQGDGDQTLKQAIAVMEKLRASITGPDADKRLTEIFIRMAGNIREQLEQADPGRKLQLIQAFGVFLDRIQSTTNDPATLQWVAKTLIDLAQDNMPPGQTKAKGVAAELLTTAVKTLERLQPEISGSTLMAVQFQLGKAHRLLGNYKAALDTLESLLKTNPLMLDAQMEAALAYELWAAEIKPSLQGKAYTSALLGGRGGVIWGWGKISQQTSRNPKYKDKFFEARYHVALCRYLAGKATKNRAMIEKSATDITKVNALYPDMGGPQQRQKYDQLLRLIQKDLNQAVTGLPPIQ